MLTVPEVARILGLDRSKVRRFCAAGRLPATKVGRDWLIKKSDALRFAKKPRKSGRPVGWKPAK